MTENPIFSSEELARYPRHLALPDFDMRAQRRLKEAHILCVGAGGLGAAALPYLAGAGVGTITIYDHDTIDITNLHRQTIYKTEQKKMSKAKATAAYLQALNPYTNVQSIDEQLDKNTIQSGSYSLILDGTDNFKTKTLLNKISIEKEIPLASASVQQYAGQCAIFAGFLADCPCYHCLFPELPREARNCNEAGVLGTAAGLTGLYQAHLALLYLCGIEKNAPQAFLSFDYKSHRMQNIHINKNPDCPHCHHGEKRWDNQMQENTKVMADLISMAELMKQDHIIIDVRTQPEIDADPIQGATHIEISQLPSRYQELPDDKLLAFVCAGNVRSVQAAEYMTALGYNNIIVLDKFSL